MIIFLQLRIINTIAGWPGIRKITENQAAPGNMPTKKEDVIIYRGL